MLWAFNQRRTRFCSCHIRPAGKQPSVLKRKVKQGRQHHRSELDGNLINPVELLADRQRIQQRLCAVADQILKVHEARPRDDFVHRFTLWAMFRRVHGDKALYEEIAVYISNDIVVDHDAAVVGIGGKLFVVLIHGHDVVVPGHRPERSVRAFFTVVHRLLGPHLGKERQNPFFAKEFGVRRINVL